MENDMENFYEQIMLVSEMHVPREDPPTPTELDISSENERIVLEMHVEEMMELICENYRDNIRAAAERGDSKAIICIYQEESTYRRIINIHKLLNPHKSLFDKYHEYEIPMLMDRLREKFQPFRVEVNPLPNNTSNYYAVIVEWILPETQELPNQ